MPQQTKVFKINAATAEDLRRRLQDALPDAEWRHVPHARFALKHGGVVLTCYQSGKVVLQGSAIETFEARFLGGASAASTSGSARDKPSPEFDLDKETIGSDETGKGDYFGPLVVTAVWADPVAIRELQQAGAADSKQLTDKRVGVLAPFVQDRLDCETARLMPADYNPQHDRKGNLNEILAALHARCLAPLLERHGDGTLVIVDKFAKESLLVRHLNEAGAKPQNLVCVPRAEAHPAVAAASVVARQVFLDGLQECSDLCGVDLHKGAGAPVDVVGRRVWQVGGEDLLRQVAKLHFKNTQRIRRG